MYLILRVLRIAVSMPKFADELELRPLDCLDYQTLVQSIERIADHIESIAKCIILVIDSGENIPESVKEVFIRASELVFENYEKTISSFMHMDIVPTNMIIDAQERILEFYSEITPLPVFSKISDSTVLSEIISIRENIMSVSSISAEIAELTIDRAYTKKT
jgi:uncharacterized protein Yka (UPF0111/DUF47 family)